MEKQEILVMGKLLEERAREEKDKVFLYFKDEKVSYKELNDTCNKVANSFVKLGVKKGDNVAIMLPNCPEFLYTWFGLAKIGAREVPVNTELKGEFLRYILDNCDAKVIVIHNEFLERLKLIQEGVPKLENVIILNGETADIKFITMPYKELLSGSAEAPEVEVDQYDLEAIAYTSGTTGPPKGVMMSHGYFYQCAAENARYRGITPEDIVYTAMPLFHGNAQWLTTVPCIIAHASLALAERFSATAFWDDIRKYHATHANLVGAPLIYVYKQPPRENDAANPLKLLFTAPIPKEIYWDFKRRFNINFFEGFGLTESGMNTYNLYEGPNPKLSSCGKVADGYEVKIVDDDDHEMPVGEVGEIITRPTRPNFMMGGYYKMPEKTLETYRDLWYHTGDYGRMDEDGYFYFVDRKKDYLRVGGENISSMQVEATINEHPKIMESAVLGVRTEGGEDALMLDVTLKPGEKLMPEEVMDWCQERLPRFAMPRYIRFFTEELPRTPSGKMQKFKLREQAITPDTWDRVKAGYKLKR